MKRVAVILFAAMFFFGYQGKAQGFHLGVLAGTNAATLSGSAFDHGLKLGYFVGAYAELNLSKQWGIQPEVFFNHVRSQTASDAAVVEPGTQILSGVDFNVSYITVPILLTFKPIPLLSLQFGPQFGAKINEDGIVASGKDAFKTGDFALTGGAQRNIARLKIGARYVGGITNIQNLSQSGTWKNNGFHVYLGFTIL